MSCELYKNITIFTKEKRCKSLYDDFFEKLYKI